MLTFHRRSLLKIGVGLSVLSRLQSSRAQTLTERRPRLGKSTINANIGVGDLYTNFAKGINVSSSEPGFQRNYDADQYPRGVLNAPLSGNFPFPPSYLGRLIWKWRGNGSLQFGGFPTIIYSGGANIVAVNASTGDLAFDIAMKDRSDPRVEFAWGFKIQSLSQSPVVDHSGSPLVRIRSKPGYGINIPDNSTMKLQGIRGQANALGIWNCAKVDNQTFDLQGSRWNASDPYTGPSGEAILSVRQVSLVFPPGRYSSFGGLVLCRSEDEAAVDTGRQLSQAAVDSYAKLNPRYLRFMDMLAVINSTATSFRYRSRPSSMTYAVGRFEPAYWVGRLSHGPEDSYSCANPTASGDGAYSDGEIVQGYADLANQKTSPTLNVGGRGAKPIFGIAITPQLMTLSGAPSLGDVVSIVFNGSHINGGSPYTFNYTVNSSPGHYGPDTNIDRLGANLTFAAGRDPVLIAAGISFGNAGGGQCSIIYNRNAGSGTTFSASISGPGTIAIAFGTLKPGTIAVNATRTYTYSKILGGWIQNNGLNSGTPLEVIAELCNRCGVGCWVNIPLLYSVDSAREFGATLAKLLRPGLPVVCELSNEVWNFAQYQTSMAMNLGCQLGFTSAGNRAYLNFYALRTCQLLPSFAEGWTSAGRSRSDLKLVTANVILEGDGHYSGGMQQYEWNGADLDISKNAVLAALGGPGGTALSVSHNAVPNRPIDLMDGVSYAIYWKGALARSTSTAWNGTQSEYDTLFQASADFASGGAGVEGALMAWDNDIRRGTRNGTIGSETIASFISPQKGVEAKLREYDGQRAKAGMSMLGVYVYEAALEQGLSANNVNGTNRVDPTDLNNQFTANRWTLSPKFGASNLEVATNIVRLFLAYKNSEFFAKNVNDLFEQVVSIHAGRDAFPAWYGYTGPNIWSLYPGDLSTKPYRSYDAIAAFNRRS